MTEQKIRGAAYALRTLAGAVPEEQWTLISAVCSELESAANQVQIFESCFSTELTAGPAELEKAGIGAPQ